MAEQRTRGVPPRVPGYEDLHEIARGGFAVVYRARQRSIGREVAIKVIARLDLDGRDRQRFEDECRVLGELSWHPHIVVVFDAGSTEDGMPFLAMEHLPGGSIGDQLAADGPVPWERVAAFGVQLSGALDAAHAAGVIHRDLKPHNVLLGPLGEAKLSDFGIALNVTGNPNSVTGQVSGTMAHVAPEVLGGQRATPRSDVYGLASTMYELLAGQAAFVDPDDDSVIPMMARIANEEPRSLAHLDVPSGLDELVRQAMAKDPEDRPGCAAEFGRSLQAIQETNGDTPTELHLSEPGSSPPATSPAADARTSPGRGDSRPTLPLLPQEPSGSSKINITADDLGDDGAAQSQEPAGPPGRSPSPAPAPGRSSPSGTRGPGMSLPAITPGPKPVAIEASSSGTQASLLSRLGANPVVSGLVVGVLAGVVGAVLGFWLNHSVIDRPVVENGVLAVTVSPLVGFLLAAWPDLTAGAHRSALRRGALGAVVGLIAAIAAVAVADPIFDRVRFGSTGDLTSDTGTLKEALWLAWVILGSLVGLGLGITQGLRKMVNGLIGGLIGGAVGGLIYVQTIDEQALLVADNDLGFSTTLGPQIVSVVATTVSVCLAIGIVERVARQAWLRVVRGPLSGKEYILYRDSSTIGSAASCDIVLAKDATVQPLHARIDRAGTTTKVTALTDAGLRVDGRETDTSTLSSGSVIGVGTFDLAYEER